METNDSLFVCTTVTRATIPWARRLNASLATHAGRTRLLVLVLDDLDLAVDPSRELFEVVRPEQLELPQFDLMAARFDREHLVRASEPSLLRLALDHSGGDPVIYLDPQTEAFAPLDEFATLAAERGVGLVARLTAPIPRDGLRPSDEDALGQGIFDPGCLACAGSSSFERALRSWTERMRHDGPPGAATTVPRWHDLLVTFLPRAAIADDPGLGVSVWNLHERRVTDDGPRVLVDGVPLRTLCFAGMEVEPGAEAARDEPRGEMLSRGAVFARQPPIARLLLDRSRFRGAEQAGLQEARGDGYAFDRLADGTPLSPRLRRLIWLAERRGGLRRSPFTGPGLEELVEFLLGAPRAYPGIPRLWTWIYEERGDLNGAFPDIRGADASSFLEWIMETGEQQNEIPPLLQINDPPAPTG